MTIKKFTTKWESHNPVPDCFYIEKFEIDDYDKAFPLISIYKPQHSNTYHVDYDYDECYSSCDLYAAIDYANKLLIENEYVELPEKLAVLL
jgi:hypothetical protein